MNKIMDLAGQRFGRLTVLDLAPRDGRAVKWNVVCECGQAFAARAQNLRRGVTRSCGCLKAQMWAESLRRRAGHLPENFWRRVIKNDGDGCWEWQSYRDVLGYGRLGLGAKLAHRVAWALANGPIPAGLLVCHKCDNPPCVRPDHLFLGTHRDNMKDMSAKGRNLRGAEHPWHCLPHPMRGEKNRHAKLTVAQVKEIRRGYMPGASNLELARKYGVHPRTIWLIGIGKSWKSVPMEPRCSTP